MSFESLPRDHSKNHFNLLRLIAACSVIVSHSFIVSGGPLRLDPLERAIGYDLGTTAVLGFFAISGYFISQSFARRESNFAFIMARATRILPALLVVSLIAAFVVGPLVTTLPLPSYFRDPAVYLYSLQNISILRIMGTHLPGVFANNPTPNTVNISLWTLYFEVACYIGLFIAGVLRLLERRWLPWLVAAYVPVYVFARYIDEPDLHWFATLSLPFIIGMIIYEYRSANLLKPWIALVLLAVAAGLGAAGHGIEELWSLAIAYGILWLGFAKAPALLAYNKVGDFSYGTYIYGFLVGQTIAYAIPGTGVVPLMLATLAISIACGALSWILVERPSIEFRKRLKWSKWWPSLSGPLLQKH